MSEKAPFPSHFETAKPLLESNDVCPHFGGGGGDPISEVCVCVGGGGGGGVLKLFEWVPPTARSGSSEYQNAKIWGQSAPLGGKNGGGQFQTEDIYNSRDSSL